MHDEPTLSLFIPQSLDHIRYGMLWLQKGREACRKAPIRFCSRCPVGGDMIPLPKGQALGIISVVTATIETKSLSCNVTLHLNVKLNF